jgi:ATP synthase F1 complex assembly factor 2
MLSPVKNVNYKHRIVKRALSAIVNLDGGAAPQVHQQIAGKQRFYKEVGVVELQEKDVGKAIDNHTTDWICKLSKRLYCVTLDGRKLRTPGRHPMVIPSQELAWGIANEWDAQMDQKRGIQPASMPLMSLFSTAIDQIAVSPDHARATVLSYLPTDSALFFTDPDDRILLKKQKEILDPVLQWMRDEMKLDLKTTDQMTLRVEQTSEVNAKVEAIVHMLDPFSLACLQCMTMESKSIVLSMAHLLGHLNLDQLKEASRIEEEFQVEIWGVVEGGHDMDRLNNSVSLSSASTFFGLLSSALPHHEALRDRKFTWSGND